jgi:hypothetical protein
MLENADLFLTDPWSLKPGKRRCISSLRRKLYQRSFYGTRTDPWSHSLGKRRFILRLERDLINVKPVGHAPLLGLQTQENADLTLFQFQFSDLNFIVSTSLFF